MAQKKRKLKIVIIILVFIIYFFIAARPIPRETILAPRWIRPLSTEAVAAANISAPVFPFTLQDNFGYVDSNGRFAINKIKTDDIYLSANMWTEYGAVDTNIVINNNLNNTVINIENTKGYPILLDNRIFILGSEQNSLSEIDNNGRVKWAYEFGSPLTCIDVKAGLVLTGSLDGAVEVFNSDGDRIFYFEPGGSRYSIILGCSISRNGSRIGIVSGIDRQRFLLFERFGNTGGEYRVIYHEFLDTGFRRPVRVLFVDDDQRIIFEREGGIGCYNIKSRRTMFIPLDGDIAAIDESGDKRYFFLITSNDTEKQLVGIRFPPDRLFGLSSTAAEDTIFIKAPFKSDDVFLGRQASGTGSILIAGGGTTLISFNLEEK